MNKIIEQHTEETGHETKQVGVVVGCTKCDYTMWTWRNTPLNDLPIEERMDALDEAMKNMSEEEIAWQDRPIRKRMEKAKKRAEKERKSQLAREILNATRSVYPCIVRGEWGKECDKSFRSKKDLRVHMLDEHTSYEISNTVENYLEE